MTDIIEHLYQILFKMKLFKSICGVFVCFYEAQTVLLTAVNPLEGPLPCCLEHVLVAFF